jgi:hypothetical protein
VSGVRFASAHHYYGSAITEGIWWIGAVVLVGAGGAHVIFAVIAFNRRDIHA